MKRHHPEKVYHMPYTNNMWCSLSSKSQFWQGFCSLPLTLTSAPKREGG